MKLIQKVIHAGFAMCALASASMPAMSWTTWPDVDFEWYANVGKPVQGTSVAAVEVLPAPREGQIYSPAHFERNASGTQTYVAGQWIADDYQQQVQTYALGPGTRLATGPMELRDSQGSVIPTTPDAYPVDSTRR